MSEVPGQSDADRGFEMALCSISPAAPAGAASDAAYEAGRRDGAAQQRPALWIHRLATAAAVVLAAMLGASTLLNEPSATQLAKESGPGNVLPDGGLEESRPASPFSYLALRWAVMGEGEIDLSQLPASPSGGSADAPESVRSIGEMLRDQRGL